MVLLQQLAVDFVLQLQLVHSADVETEVTVLRTERDKLSDQVRTMAALKSECDELHNQIETMEASNRQMLLTTEQNSLTQPSSEISNAQVLRLQEALKVASDELCAALQREELLQKEVPPSQALIPPREASIQRKLCLGCMRVHTNNCAGRALSAPIRVTRKTGYGSRA